MARRDVSKMQQEILHYIAENGPATEYQLLKNANVSSFTAHQAPKILLKKGLLKAEPKGKARTGRTIKLYSLTFAGLFTVLSKAEITWEDRCNIIERQADMLPLVFSKWRHFISCGLRKEELLNALSFIRSQLSALTPSVDTAMRAFFLYVFNATPPHERVRWLKALRDDPDLLKWALREEKAFQSYATMMKETFKLLREPKPDWEKALEKLRRL